MRYVIIKIPKQTLMLLSEPHKTSWLVKVKSKAVTVLGGGGVSRNKRVLTSALDGGQLMTTLPVGKEYPVLTVQEAGRAPEPVCMLYSRDSCCCLEENLGHATHSNKTQSSQLSIEHI
jgi:hypothetical protein